MLISKIQCTLIYKQSNTSSTYRTNLTVQMPNQVKVVSLTNTSKQYNTKIFESSRTFLFQLGHHKYVIDFTREVIYT